MSFKFIPSTNRTNNDKLAIKKITRWIESILLEISKKQINNIERFNITVTEILCSEPNCAPIETLIVLIGNSNSKYTEKILKPCIDVVENDVKMLECLQIIENKVINKYKYNELNTIIDGIWSNSSELSDKEQFVKYLEEKYRSFNDQLRNLQTNNLTNISNNSLKITNEIKPQKMIVQSAPLVPVRHDKGTRPRGCPCCDPDNIENIVDKILFLDCPP